jgi:hypothetical protein
MAPRALSLLALGWLAASPTPDDEPVSFSLLFAHHREGALDPCG